MYMFIFVYLKVISKCHPYLIEDNIQLLKYIIPDIILFIFLLLFQSHIPTLLDLPVVVF